MSASTRYFFEALADHDRDQFDCGSAELNDYLRRLARQDARRRVAAPFVMIDASRRVLGYYTLSAYGIRTAELPLEISKKLPRYPLIPATLLGRLAVSVELQGRRLGALLLMDALKRSWKTSAEIASVGIVAEVMNDLAKRFYLHHQFVPLPEQPRKMFLAMKTIEALFA